MSFKTVIVFLTIHTLVFAQNQNPEIAYINSDAISSLQEILATEFELMNKKVDALTPTRTSIPTTAEDFPSTTTTSIENNLQDEGNSLKKKKDKIKKNVHHPGDKASQQATSKKSSQSFEKINIW